MPLTTVVNEMLTGPISGGGGAENLITNGTGEAASVSIFTAYADAAGTRPVDGTGGTPNVTTALNTTVPINGTKDFTLIKDAVNRQGQGWAVTPISIPLAYRAKPLKVSIKTMVTSGTFVAGNNGSSPADGDMIWYWYDITNSKLVEPSNFKMFSNATTLSDTYEANVQFDYNAASVRLIAHIGSTSALAYTLQVDDVTLTPERLTSSESSVSFNAYKSGGNNNGTAGVISFTSVGETHNGFNLTTGEYSVKVAGDYQCGFNYEWAASQGVGFAFRINGVVVSSYSNSASSVYGGGDFLLRNLKVGDLISLASSTGSVLNLTTFYFYGSKTAGQSQIADSSNTRLEYFSATKTTSQSISNITSTKLTFDTYTNNTHGSWDVANNRYVVKTTGPVNIAGTIGWAANATGYRQVAYSINGGTVEVANQTNSVGAGDATVNGFSAITPHLVAGDYIELYGYQSSGAALNASFNLARLRITKVAGPQAIAASEKVSFSYGVTTSLALAAATVTTVPANVKRYDSHNIYNTGTGEWKMPRAGVGEVKARFLTANIAAGTTNYYAQIEVYKNGASYKLISGHINPGAGTTTYPIGWGAVDIEGTSTDVWTVRAYYSVATSIFADSTQCYIDFKMD